MLRICEVVESESNAESEGGREQNFASQRDKDYSQYYYHLRHSLCCASRFFNSALNSLNQRTSICFID
jgi:hypothetical protein